MTDADAILHMSPAGSQDFLRNSPETGIPKSPGMVTRCSWPLPDLEKAFRHRGRIGLGEVQHFQGRAGDDLDNGTEADHTALDDHVFNYPLKWSRLVDSVAMRGFAVPDDLILYYRFEGFIFPGTADLTVPMPAITANGYTPDTVARYRGNQEANNGASWYGANIEGTGATSIAYNTFQYFPFTPPAAKSPPAR